MHLNTARQKDFSPVSGGEASLGAFAGEESVGVTDIVLRLRERSFEMVVYEAEIEESLGMKWSGFMAPSGYGDI